jgi:hypothetical protein
MQKRVHTPRLITVDERRRRSLVFGGPASAVIGGKLLTLHGRSRARAATGFGRRSFI